MSLSQCRPVLDCGGGGEKEEKYWLHVCEHVALMPFFFLSPPSFNFSEGGGGGGGAGWGGGGYGRQIVHNNVFMSVVFSLIMHQWLNQERALYGPTITVIIIMVIVCRLVYLFVTFFVILPPHLELFRVRMGISAIIIINFLHGSPRPRVVVHRR